MTNDKFVRLGGPLFEAYSDPEQWIARLRSWGYSAAYCPLDEKAPDSEVTAYRSAASEAGILIAEVGAWSNPVSPNSQQRDEAIDFCCIRLDLAERIGALCCVNIAGSRNPDIWDGAHADNYSQHTFDLIVSTVQYIIDQVKPERTRFTLEPMPWIFPDSCDSYLKLIKEIDRPGFAVHLDPVNMINSPDKYFSNGELIRECFERMGDRIRSCHGKDILLQQELTTHLSEVQPGEGNLDYAVFLEQLSRRPDVPLMLEHMTKPGQYQSAIEYIKKIARERNINIL